MSAIFTIVGWYAVGFVLADRLVVRGHSPVVWWTGAALLGALVAVPAAYAVFRRRRPTTPADVVRIGVPADGLHLAAIGSVDHLDASLAAVPGPLATRVGRVSLVATVGHEAFSPAFETGERSAAKRALRQVRPMAPDDDRLVLPGAIDAAAGAFDVVGVPDLVVTSVEGRRSTIRRRVAQGIDAARRGAVPIMFVPASTDRDRRPAPASEVVA